MTTTDILKLSALALAKANELERRAYAGEENLYDDWAAWKRIEVEMARRLSIRLGSEEAAVQKIYSGSN
jgi:hypothetical protein